MRFQLNPKAAGTPFSSGSRDFLVNTNNSASLCRSLGPFSTACHAGSARLNHSSSPVNFLLTFDHPPELVPEMPNQARKLSKENSANYARHRRRIPQTVGPDAPVA